MPSQRYNVIIERLEKNKNKFEYSLEDVSKLI